MIIINGISDSWSDAIYGQITFFGVLVRYYDQIACRWNEETQSRYNKDYEKYILPDLDNKPIAECTREDFDHVLACLKEKKSREGLVYNDDVVRHIRHIIKRVLEVAANNGICQDVLWGSEYSINEKEEEKLNVKEFVRLRKSFTLLEEIEIDKRIMHNPEQSGQFMGLALMYSLGLRNNEACAAKFNSIKPMEPYPACYCLWVYESTVLQDLRLKSGGKTPNAVRIIPIPQALLQLINERRKYLKQKIRDSLFVDPSNQINSDSTEEEISAYIDQLPIACLNEQYNTNCGARHLTAVGTALFKEVAIALKEENDLELQLALIDKDIRRPGRNEEGIEEKDPTAYLFRRNLGTLLYILGLEEWEIQYVLGHDVEDPNEVRSYFRNEEKLYPIYCKMAQRPILNDISKVKETVLDSCYRKETNVHSFYLRITVDSSTNKYKLHIKQKEPLDMPNVSIKCENASVPGTYDIYPNTDEYDHSLNIVSAFHKECNRLLNKRISI